MFNIILLIIGLICIIYSYLNIDNSINNKKNIKTNLIAIIGVILYTCGVYLIAINDVSYIDEQYNYQENLNNINNINYDKI